MAMLQFFIEVRDLNRFSSNMVIVNQLAQQQIEQYRNTPYNNLVVGTQNIAGILTPYPTLLAPRSATATITELQPNGLKQIDLTITFTGKGGLKTTSVTTLVASRGINK